VPIALAAWYNTEDRLFNYNFMLDIPRSGTTESTAISIPLPVGVDPGTVKIVDRSFQFKDYD
jgi:hypothetical protein